MQRITSIILFILLIFCASCSQNLLIKYPAKTKDGLLNVVVEIPAGTSEKWEVMKPQGNLELEYVNNKPRIIQYLPYPFNYGMIPKTLLPKNQGGDGDPLDAVVIGNSVKRGDVVNGKVIGVLKMLDRGERDDKIIIIAKTSPLYFVNDVKQLNQEFVGVTQIIQTWFKNYKGAGKIEIQGFGNIAEANNIIDKAIIGANSIR